MDDLDADDVPWLEGISERVLAAFDQGLGLASYIVALPAEPDQEGALPLDTDDEEIRRFRKELRRPHDGPLLLTWRGHKEPTTPEEIRFHQFPLVQAFRWLTVTAIVLVVVGACASDCRSVSDEAARLSEITACGKPGCAVGRSGPRRDQGGRYYAYAVSWSATGSDGELLIIRVRCPRRHSIVGEHECRAVSSTPAEHDPDWRYGRFR